MSIRNLPIRNLKAILAFDGVTCTGVFLLSLFAAVPVAGLLGLPVAVITIDGWICLASAIVMFVAAAQTPPSPALTKLIALGNLGWVVASLAVLGAFAGQMAGIGQTLVVMQAVAILVMAIIEWKGAAVAGNLVAA